MPVPLIPDNSFPPGRNDPCYCGSGERFKHCCGNKAGDRHLPSGIAIVENFLSPEECRNLVAMADAMEGWRFQVTDGDGNRVLDQHRMTEWVDFRSTNQQYLDDILARGFQDYVIPYLGQSIEWYEEPQLLRYKPGDYYLHHSDAYLLVPEEQAWKKAVDRDVSLIIYPNDDYEGGGLDFKRLSYTLQPRAGMLVWFPSDIRYEHMALPVTRGTRYALVSWAAVTGMERVQEARAKGSIDWVTREKMPSTG